MTSAPEFSDMYGMACCCVLLLYIIVGNVVYLKITLFSLICQSHDMVMRHTIVVDFGLISPQFHYHAPRLSTHTCFCVLPHLNADAVAGIECASFSLAQSASVVKLPERTNVVDLQNSQSK